MSIDELNEIDGFNELTEEIPTLMHKRQRDLLRSNYPFKQYVTDNVFTLRLRSMHNRNQMIIDGVFTAEQWNYESCPYMRPDDEIWCKWYNAASDPIGDIDELFKVLKTRHDDYNADELRRNIINNGFISPDEAREIYGIFPKHINVGTIGHIDHGKSVIQTVVNNIREANLALIMFGESLQAVNFPFENIELTSLDRRYMMTPEVIIEKPNNKPWYNDHRNNRSKKSRRKL